MKLKESSKRQRTGEENAQKARPSRCWQSVRASLVGASKLLVPSCPFDEMLFAALGFALASSTLAFLLLLFLRSPHHLFLPVAHSCASTVPLSHPLGTGNAVTWPSALGLCTAPPPRNPSPDRMRSPPFAFAHSSGCTYGPPATMHIY